jgi:hypothetical protein
VPNGGDTGSGGDDGHDFGRLLSALSGSEGDNGQSSLIEINWDEVGQDVPVSLDIGSFGAEQGNKEIFEELSLYLSVGDSDVLNRALSLVGELFLEGEALDQYYEFITEFLISQMNRYIDIRLSSLGQATRNENPEISKYLDSHLLASWRALGFQILPQVVDGELVKNIVFNPLVIFAAAAGARFDQLYFYALGAQPESTGMLIFGRSIEDQNEVDAAGEGEVNARIVESALTDEQLAALHANPFASRFLEYWQTADDYLDGINRFDDSSETDPQWPENFHETMRAIRPPSQLVDPTVLERTPADLADLLATTRPLMKLESPVGQFVSPAEKIRNAQPSGILQVLKDRLDEIETDAAPNLLAIHLARSFKALTLLQGKIDGLRADKKSTDLLGSIEQETKYNNLFYFAALSLGIIHALRPGQNLESFDLPVEITELEAEVSEEISKYELVVVGKVPFLIAHGCSLEIISKYCAALADSNYALPYPLVDKTDSEILDHFPGREENVRGYFLALWDKIDKLSGIRITNNELERIIEVVGSDGELML